MLITWAVYNKLYKPKTTEQYAMKMEIAERTGLIPQA